VAIGLTVFHRSNEVNGFDLQTKTRRGGGSAASWVCNARTNESWTELPALFAENDDWHRFEHDLEVFDDALTLDVLEIVPDLLPHVVQTGVI
jgi:hypothetical protein